MASLSDYLRPDLFTYKWRIYGDVALLFQGNIDECARYWLTGEHPVIVPEHLIQQDSLRIGRYRGRIQFEKGKVVDPKTLVPLFPTQDILTIDQLRNFLGTIPQRLASIETKVQREFSMLRV